MKDKVCTPVNPENNRRLYLIILVALAIILGLFIATWFLVPRLAEDSAISNPGIFGDMYGATNALFSGLALLAVVVAILLQSKELSLQRKAVILQTEELTDTREVLDQQREQMELQRQQMELQSEQLKKQSDELRMQREAFEFQLWENTFFKLNSMLNEYIDNMNVFKTKGRACFQQILSHFGSEVDRVKHSDRSKRIQTAYENMMKSPDPYSQTNILRNYFLLVSELVLHLDSAPRRQNTGSHTRIFIAQFTDCELVLLFYHLVFDSIIPFDPAIKMHLVFGTNPNMLLEKEDFSLLNTNGL